MIHLNRKRRHPIRSDTNAQRIKHRLQSAAVHSYQTRVHGADNQISNIFVLRRYHQKGSDVRTHALYIQRCVQRPQAIKPSDSTQNAIPSKMFLTPKKLPSGAIDKMKARLVAGGHHQDRSLYTAISSPTASLTAVSAQAALAAQRGDSILTLNHKAAYLNAVMKGPAVKMILSKEVSTILCEISNEFKVYPRANGTILVQLEKALYGCIQSAVLWDDELSNTLKDLGYKKNPYDTCVFNKVRDG